MKRLLFAATTVIGLAALPAFAQTTSNPGSPAPGSVHGTTSQPDAHRADRYRGDSRANAAVDRQQAQVPAGQVDWLGNHRGQPNALQKGNRLNNSQ